MSHSVKDQKAIRQASKMLRRGKIKGSKKLAKRLQKIKDPRKARTKMRHSQKVYEGNPNS